MVKFNFTYDYNVGLEQQIGFQMAAAIWSSLLTDDVTINLHIGAVHTLGEDGQAVGGAIPVFHETHYGIYQEYLKQDATSTEDALVLDALQQGNTVDLLVDTDRDASTASELIDGNTELMLTRAQAKALGMENPLALDNGTIWDRDVLENPHALDGYILINNTYNWHYDFVRQAEAPEHTLDFLTMALHEIGHSLGFVSGLDGLLDTFILYSGEQRTEGFTALDLMRYSETSARTENPDGSVSDLSFGGSAYFSIDGGQTSLAEFEEGNEYQASHWQRFRNALGIMDPTLGYQERTDISKLDLTAFDAIGWNVSYDALANGLNLNELYVNALKAVGGDVDAVVAALTQSEDWQNLGHEAWFNAFKEQILAQGWGTWFQGYDSHILEQGWGTWFQAFQAQVLEQGWGTWFQELQAQMLKQGWGTWFQDAETQMLEQGWGTWFQALEEHLLNQLWGTWFQAFEEQLLNQLWGTWFQDFEAQVLEQGWGTWFQKFEAQVLEQGWGTWFQAFEETMLAQNWGAWFQEFDEQMLNQNWGTWFQKFDAQVLEQGWGTWFQKFETKAFKQGWGTWFQQYETQLLEQGWGTWFQHIESQLLQQGWGTWFQKFESQVLEQGWGTWFQKIDSFLDTLENADSGSKNVEIANSGVGGQNASIYEGGQHDDIIAGDQKQDRIDGKEGSDLIDGKGGHDVIWGGAGNDILYGQDGNDLIYGGDDDDLILGEADNDELHGQAGHDIIDGGHGDDIVTGGVGNDDLKGGRGRDVISGDAGSDRLDGGADNDILIGGTGRDQIYGGSGDDFIYGDHLTADAAATLKKLRQQLQQQSGGSQLQVKTTEPSTTSSYNPIRVEAEAMTLAGDYEIHTGFVNDSGDILRTDSIATATTTFTGPAGKYLIVARYFDDNLGQGSLAVDFNGSPLDNWTLDRDDDHYYTRTIAQAIDLEAGDQFTITATAGGEDPAYFDYLEFVPLDNLIVTQLETSTSPNSSNTTTSTLINASTLRVEAESMALVGDYRAANYSFASGGQLIEVAKQGQGKALTTFKGDTGLYNIVIGYHDENDDGIAQLSTSLNGVLLDEWQLDQNLGTAVAGLDNFVTRTVASGVILSNGDVFEITGLRGEGDSSFEPARIDYIDFVKVDASTEDPANLATPSSIQTSFGQSLADGLVASWAFDETIGLVAKDSTGIHHGSLLNSANNDSSANGDSQWEAGKTNQALKLDGVDDYLAIANSSDINTAIHGQRTISLWFKSDDITIAERKQVLYEEGGSTRGLSIYLHDGKLYVGGWNADNKQSGWTGTFLHTDAIASGEWHHVALVLDGNDKIRKEALTAYLDGEIFGTGAGSQLWSHSDAIAFGAVNGGTRFHDGTVSGSGTHAFAGSLDDARIFNRALTSDHVGLLIGRDDDLLEGGTGNDVIFGNEGNDVIYGESKVYDRNLTLRGAQTYNGHTYLLSQAGSWTDAQAEARRLGGNLVTINDAAEESWLRATFSQTERLWMGLTDAADEGQWKWVSGEAVAYTNWAPGEPNNDGSLQHYGVINYQNQWDDTQLEGSWLQDQTGTWFWQNGLRGIIEINAAYNDTLVGGTGNDILYGNVGDDQLYGDDFSPSGSSALSHGLVGHWTFDQPSGIVAEDATGNYSGTLANPSSNQWIDGQVGGALAFDKSHVTIADSPGLDITDTITLATWVKAVEFENWNGLILKGTQNIAYGLDLAGDGRLIFTANYGSLSGAKGAGDWYSSTRLKAGQWHHVAATYDGSTLQFYIDGQLDANVIQTNLTFGTNNENLVLGADLAAASYFEGALDDARIYNRALMAEEIEQLVSGKTQTETLSQGGDDVLYGGIGNDFLDGGSGDDVLIGTDALAAGYFEKDILKGGLGADSFVLGDASRAYYLGNSDRDYALIKDFDPLQDTVLMYGSAANYTQQHQGSDIYLFYQGASPDLIAIFENKASLNFSAGFVFV